MILLPDLYYENVQSISIEELLSRKIQGIAIDVDNTLIDFKQNMSNEIPKWISSVKSAGLKVCILSNSNRLTKIQKVAQKLQIDYFLKAKKPLKNGFKKVSEHMALLPANIAVIGDQIFTDVWGANRMKMLSIYVVPIDKKEHWYTRIKRPFESLVLKYYKQKEEEK